MPVIVNLRHLEARDAHLQGELPVAELDIDTRDEMIQLSRPLKYDLTVQQIEKGLLAQGKLRVPLNCQCVRCLKPFQLELKLDHWAE